MTRLHLQAKNAYSEAAYTAIPLDPPLFKALSNNSVMRRLNQFSFGVGITSFGGYINTSDGPISFHMTRGDNEVRRSRLYHGTLPKGHTNFDITATGSSETAVREFIDSVVDSWDYVDFHMKSEVKPRYQSQLSSMIHFHGINTVLIDAYNSLREGITQPETLPSQEDKGYQFFLVSTMPTFDGQSLGSNHTVHLIDRAYGRSPSGKPMELALVYAAGENHIGLFGVMVYTTWDTDSPLVGHVRSAASYLLSTNHISIGGIHLLDATQGLGYDTPDLKPDPRPAIPHDNIKVTEFNRNSVRNSRLRDHEAHGMDLDELTELATFVFEQTRK